MASLLLVMGKNSPFYFLFSLPPFNYFRVPSKFLLLTVSSLAVLSGFTIDHVLKKINNRFLLITRLPARQAFCFLLLTIFFFDEFKISYNYPPVSNANLWLSQPMNISELKSRSNRIKTYGQEMAWNEIFLTDGWQDLNSYLKFKNYLYPNYNIFFGVSSVGLNTGGLIPRRSEFWRSLIDNVVFDRKNNSLILSDLSRQSLKIWGVDTILTPYTLNDPDWYLENGTLAEKNSDINIYRTKFARIPFYFASNIIKTQSVEDFYRELAGLKKDEVLAEDDFDLNGQSLLVFNRSWYPGWHIFIDGKEAPIKIVNLNQPAVITANTPHRISFSFKSNSFNLGKKISILSYITAFLTVFLSSLRSSHKLKAIP